MIALSTICVTGLSWAGDAAQQIVCGQDQFEPNNRRGRSKNLSIALRDDREVMAMTCGTDEDWYTVWLNRGELVEIHMTTQLDPLPYLRIFGPRKRKPSGIMRKVSPSHTKVKLYAKRSGRYRIFIKGRDEVGSRYHLSLHHPAY